MMRKKFPVKSLLLALVLIAAVTLPSSFSQGIRTYFAYYMGPVWEKLTFHSNSRLHELEIRVRELEAENQLLKQLPSYVKPLFKSLEAKVIFRSHAGWQNFLWINIGSDKAPFNLKNAPVILGDVVVGVIDEVLPKQSKVRLITDPHLNPSVRVVRKGLPLAKGELNGAVKPSYRRSGATLKGTGFNYDFPDIEGPARDLRHDIIKPEDLLVTTGFDGVFPKGLKVAKVARVMPLKEGDFYYEVEAESLAGSLNNLEIVHILPTLN